MTSGQSPAGDAAAPEALAEAVRDRADELRTLPAVIAIYRASLA
jgi:hypothetical protein